MSIQIFLKGNLFLFTRIFFVFLRPNKLGQQPPRIKKERFCEKKVSHGVKTSNSRHVRSRQPRAENSERGTHTPSFARLFFLSQRNRTHGKKQTGTKSWLTKMGGTSRSFSTTGNLPLILTQKLGILFREWKILEY